MKRAFLAILLAAISLPLFSATQRQYIWPKGKMPDRQDHQIAATIEASKSEGFKPEKNRLP